MTVTLPTMLGIMAILGLVSFVFALGALLLAREERKPWAHAFRSGVITLAATLTCGVGVVTSAFNLLG